MCKGRVSYCFRKAFDSEGLSLVVILFYGSKETVLIISEHKYKSKFPSRTNASCLDMSRFVLAEFIHFLTILATSRLSPVSSFSLSDVHKYEKVGIRHRKKRSHLLFVDAEMTYASIICLRCSFSSMDVVFPLHA